MVSVLDETYLEAQDSSSNPFCIPSLQLIPEPRRPMPREPGKILFFGNLTSQFLDVMCKSCVTAYLRRNMEFWYAQAS